MGTDLRPVNSIHTLRVSCCTKLRGEQACGWASVKVTLIDLPLEARILGGDRSVGEDDGLQLDASESIDPDDIDALPSSAF